MCQVWSQLSVVLVPAWVGTRPVELELFNGSVIAVAAAGAFVRVGRAALAAALLAPLPLWLPVDIVSWWTGHHFGPPAANWLVRRYPASKRAVDRSERLIDRFGIASVMLAPWLPLPTALLYAANGWRRMPLLVFIAADAAGTTARAAIMVLIGYTAGAHAVTLVRSVSDYAGWATGGVVAVLAAGLLLQARHVQVRAGGAGRGEGLLRRLRSRWRPATG